MFLWGIHEGYSCELVMDELVTESLRRLVARILKCLAQAFSLVSDKKRKTYDSYFEILLETGVKVF